MSIASAAWCEPECYDPSAVDLGSLEDVEALLDTLDHAHSDGRAVLVALTRPNGDSLRISVGRPTYLDQTEQPVAYDPPYPPAVLTFTYSHQDPPYYSSFNEAPLPWDLAVFADGELTEVEAIKAVPMSAARAAVREFLFKDGLPTSVLWEED